MRKSVAVLSIGLVLSCFSGFSLSDNVDDSNPRLSLEAYLNEECETSAAPASASWAIPDYEASPINVFTEVGSFIGAVVYDSEPSHNSKKRFSIAIPGELESYQFKQEDKEVDAVFMTSRFDELVVGVFRMEVTPDIDVLSTQLLAAMMGEFTHSDEMFEEDGELAQLEHPLGEACRMPVRVSYEDQVYNCYFNYIRSQEYFYLVLTGCSIPLSRANQLALDNVVYSLVEYD